MNVRPADAGDVPALAAILAANDEPMDWPDLPGPRLAVPRAPRRRRARTAVAMVGDVVVGFGGSVAVGRDDVRFVTDLFVDPRRQSRGAGRAARSHPCWRDPQNA